MIKRSVKTLGYCHVCREVYNYAVVFPLRTKPAVANGLSSYGNVRQRNRTAERWTAGAGDVANRESATSWKEFLLGLKQRGLRGVRLVVSDQHEGLKRAVAEILTEPAWQRCYVHFLRNALDHLPRKNADDCLLELRWLYDRRDVNEARQDLVAWVKRWEREILQAMHLGGREH